jgi:hypothetical protein
MAYKPELLIENVLWIFSAIALPAYSLAPSGGHEACWRDAARHPALALYGLAIGTALRIAGRGAGAVLRAWTPVVVQP